MVARRILIAVLLAAASLPRISGAQMTPSELPGGACGGRELACASSATPLMTPDGTLWLAWTAGGFVSVARSSDGGRSFTPAVAIDSEPKVMDAGPDARPKIVRDPATGRITVAYSIFKDEHWNAAVLVSRSTDDGRSFEKPYELSADPASARFEALALTPGGDLLAAWIDKRDEAASRRAGKEYPGAAIAFAWSKDDGETFGTARIAKDNSCECCRLAVALTPAGRPAIMFRNIFDGGVRDHAVTTFSADGTPGPLYRVSVDDWAINGCPHHGPSLAISPAGTYHAAWFTMGRARQGVFYARFVNGGQSFSEPRLLAGPAAHGARPYVLADRDEVWLAWKQFDGVKTSVHAQVSHDDGQNWSALRAVAETGAESDHPLLVSDGHRVYLSWMTHKDGYRLIGLDPGW